jgi:hypothetical protein
MDTPFGFDVELDRELFTLDRLDDLYRKGVASGNAGAQEADPGFERTQDPTIVTLRRPIVEEVAERKLHIWIKDVTSWAPEYAESRDRLLDAAGVDRSQRLFHVVATIRVFSPEAPVSLHADPETQITAGVSGRHVWHFSWPSGLSQQEHENLLHGGQFLSRRELPIFETFDLHPGQCFGAPPRWPHWIEHPGPDPAVSFDVGFFTVDDIRDRKVWDVNWMLRKTRVVKPRPPRESAAKDRVKQRVFDAISVATRRGTEFLGA